MMMLGYHIHFTLQIEKTYHSARSTEVCRTDRRRFMDCALEVVRRHGPSVRPKTADNWLCAVRSFVRFTGSDVTLGQVTADTIRRYDQWMRDTGHKPNYIACNLRNLRSVLGKCGVVVAPLFAAVRTANCATAKRAITEGELRAVGQLVLPAGTFMALARDVLLFCYYAMGMPFADVARLRRDNLREGYIEYCRHKTGQPVRVRMEAPMRDIIRKYAREGSPYLFPLLHTPATTHLADVTAQHRAYLNILNRYNKALKRIAARLHLTSRLTSYTARHTWASIAASSGAVGITDIAHALGHTNTNTTQVYIRLIDDGRLERANRQLIRRLSCPRPYRRKPNKIPLIM